MCKFFTNQTAFNRSFVKQISYNYVMGYILKVTHLFLIADVAYCYCSAEIFGLGGTSHDVLRLLFGKHRALYTSAQSFSSTMFELFISNSLPIIASTSVKTADICQKGSTEQTWLFIEFVNLTVKKRERRGRCEWEFADKVDLQSVDRDNMSYPSWRMEVGVWKKAW